MDELFREFPKMARLSREMILTEKLDGTNASIIVVPVEDYANYSESQREHMIARVGNLFLFAGSRTRIITPADDNYGFAGWVERNSQELAKLGPGRHFGEWWGNGIQRKYGMKEKCFSLFNTSRWAEQSAELRTFPTSDPRKVNTQEYAPTCCRVVPELYRGPFDTQVIDFVLGALQNSGSVASPGFPSPEGIVVYHSAGSVGFKKTLDGDGHKGAR
jgi:hypothetical protein